MWVNHVIVFFREKQKKNFWKKVAEHAVKDHGYKEEEVMTPEM